MEKIRPALRPDIQAAVQPLIDEAQVKGYAAGLEAAAQCAEKHERSYTTYPENWNRHIAKAIRALGKEAE